MELDQKFWEDRYENGQIGWDAGNITTPLKEYFDQLTDKNQKMLIPGCGNAYEAQYLHKQGFRNVYVADVALKPLQRLARACENFPEGHLIHGDFFDMEGTFDLIIEQTFFCSMTTDMRAKYAKTMHNRLKIGGKLVGILFSFPLKSEGPPFGGDINEYRTYFEPYFTFEVFEPCYNSIRPRQGSELFMILSKR